MTRRKRKAGVDQSRAPLHQRIHVTRKAFSLRFENPSIRLEIRALADSQMFANVEFRVLFVTCAPRRIWWLLELVARSRTRGGHGLGELAGMRDVSRSEWWRGCCERGLVRRCSVAAVRTRCGVLALVGADDKRRGERLLVGTASSDKASPAEWRHLAAVGRSRSSRE
ncbi:hypothetical protein Syun_014396 [Stephania yunnanensis]|uniref:Uncharacterized protein n=1 Tax=Stephania yunnanensis TaxID=152371 RepID=A0AAP0JJ87_9MAGN